MPRPHQRHRLGLRREHDVVERALLGREGAVGRIGAGDVGGVAGHLRAEVGQHQAVADDRPVVRLVMQRRRIPSGGDDRGEGPAAGAEVAEGVLDRRLQLVLVRRGEDAGHRRLLRLGGDVDRALDQRELGGALDLAHREQQRRRVAEPDVGVVAAEIVGEALLAGQRAAGGGAIVHHQPDRRAPRADGREECRHAGRREVAALRRRAPAASLEQRVDERGEAPRRDDLAHAGRGGDLFGRRDDAGPALVRRIAIARENHFAPLALARQQDQRRIGFVQAGEVEEVVFLAERPVDVAGAARRFAGKSDERRVWSDRGRQRRAPRLILRGGDAAALRGRLHREQDEGEERCYRESHGRHDSLRTCARSSAG